MWEDAYRVAKSHGNQTAHKQVSQSIGLVCVYRLEDYFESAVNRSRVSTICFCYIAVFSQKQVFMTDGLL